MKSPSKKVTRYSAANLAADLIRFNALLEKANHKFRLSLDGAYGLSFVNLATPEQVKNNCCERLLCSGKPSHCLDKVNAYLVGVMGS